MKKKAVFRPLVALSLCIYLPMAVLGQTYYDFASAFTGTISSQSSALVRTIDNTSALVYYYDGIQYVIARVDLSMSLKKVPLPPYCKVSDMRIVGDDVYFCGMGSNGPAIGHLSLSNLTSSPSVQLDLYEANTDYITSFERMVAYDVGGGHKVVAIGRVVYTGSNVPNFNCPHYITNPDGTITYYYNCLRTFIVEADFNGTSIGNVQYVTTNDETNHFEIISEVIETENYVAFIGTYANRNATVVHRCGKNSVITDFSGGGLFWYYTPDEGRSNYHGCLMKGDTIAVASLSTYYDGAGQQQFSTNVRVFDLSTMANTQAQLVPLNTKTEPYDLMYMHGKGRLVLLQDICVTPYLCNQNLFVHLEPYNNASPYYTAKCWYEDSWSKPFYSLNWLDGTHYLASGGEYWCIKSLAPFSINTCYKHTPFLDVQPLSLQAWNTDPVFPYTACPNPIISTDNFYEPPLVTTISSGCIFP